MDVRVAMYIIMLFSINTRDMHFRTALVLIAIGSVHVANSVASSLTILG